MPRPNIPLRGGPLPPSWMPETPAALSSAAASSAPAATARLTRQELEEEVERLRRELAQARDRQEAAGESRLRSGSVSPQHLLWTALTLTGIGLLFALLAILNHG